MGQQHTLFLDDSEARIAEFKREVSANQPDWLVDTARTAPEAIKFLKTHAYDWLFLDHDLGGEVFVDSRHPNCGMEVVRYIEKYLPRVKEGIVVHTWNIPAGIEMADRLRRAGYKCFRLPFGEF